MTTESSASKQPGRGSGRPFKPGRSGNPQGKPAGARNRVTLALEKLLDGEAEAITRKAVEMAKAGDSLAMRLVLERVLPLRRGRPVRFTLPDMEGPGDLVTALGGILRAVAEGELTPDEAGTIANIFDAKRRAVETTDIEVRLAAIEKTVPTR